jgi:hypothetical protein
MVALRGATIVFSRVRVRPRYTLSSPLLVRG